MLSSLRETCSVVLVAFASVRFPPVANRLESAKSGHTASFNMSSSKEWEHVIRQLLDTVFH